MMCKVYLIALGALLLLCTSCYTKIDTQRIVDLDERGILINEKGDVTDNKIYEPGGYFINSNDSLLLFPISQKEFLVDGSVITKDKEMLKIVFRVTYQPRIEDLLMLYERFGLGYEKYLINQESLQSARDVVSLASRDSIYNDGFKPLEAQIMSRLKEAFKRNYIDLTGLFELLVFEDN